MQPAEKLLGANAQPRLRAKPADHRFLHLNMSHVLELVVARGLVLDCSVELKPRMAEEYDRLEREARAAHAADIPDREYFYPGDC